MSVKKYILGMRPKKYLTRDFIVYQDPSSQSQEASIEMQAGGIVQREGFEKGSPKPKLTRKNRPKPALDRLSDALLNAYAKDDIRYLIMNSGIGNFSELDRANLSNILLTDENAMQYVSKNSGLSTEEILDLIDDRDAYSELEGASKRAKLGAERLYGDERKFYQDAEQWIMKNAKRYDDPAKFKKAFKRTFPKNNYLLNAINSNKTTPIMTQFTDDFKREIFGMGEGRSPGGKVVPGKATKDISRIGTNSSVLDDVFRIAIYNFNPTIRNKIRNEFMSIIPKGASVSDKQALSIKTNLEKSKLLKQFGLDKKIKGPISRLILKDLGENLFNSISEFRKPFQTVESTLVHLKDKVNPKYREAFKETLQAVRYAKKSLWKDAKQQLNLAQNINFDHKIPKALIDAGYADEINYIKLTPVSGDFNTKVKNIEFDRPLIKLVKKYELASPNEKRKIFNEIQSLKDSFNKKTKGYLEDVTVAEKKGKLTFESKAKPLTKQTDIVSELSKNLSQGLKETSSKDLTNIISTLAPGCRVNYADGGRVNYSTGSDCFNRGVEVLKQATQGDKTALQKVKANVKQFGKAGGKLLRWLELPVEIIAEGLFVGYDMAFNGKPYSEAVKDSGLILRLTTSDFKTSGEEDRANAIAEANPEAAKYIEAKRALDKYNSLKNDVMTFKDDLASADSYEAAAKKFDEYEKKIQDKLPQYVAILTPGSPEYEAFKTDRTGLAKERNDKVYDQAIAMSQMDPIEGPVDEQKVLEARDKRFEGQINEIGSIYDWKPTLDEYKKNVIPNIYKATNKVLGENAEFDAFIEDFVGKQYNKDLDLFSRPGFAGGGLTRRGFLKFIGGLTAAAAAIKTGIVKLTTPAAKQVLKNAPTGTPDWFAPLVEKILKEGVDVPNANVKTVTGREKVTKLEMPSEGAEGTLTDKYYLFENPDTGEIRVDIDVPGVGANDNEFSIFMRPDRVEGINDDGTPQLSEGEFFLSEDRAAGIQSGPDDWDMELLSTDVSLEDSASDWHAVEKFATGKTNKAAQAEKQKFKNAVEADPTQDIVNRYGEYDYPGPDVDDYE